MFDVVKTTNAVNQDKLNMLFSGTLVASGNGIAVVCSIGNFFIYSLIL